MAKQKAARKRRRLLPIHRNIKALREGANLSQSALAALIDSHRTHVWHWENGDSRPNNERLPKVAAALGVTIDRLFADTTS